MPKPVLYLASPYSHPTTAIERLRYLAVGESVTQLLADGTFVYSPIIHCYWLAMLHDLPTDIDFWREYDEAMISLLPRFGILKLPGWSTSIGIAHERLFALDLGREIETFTPSGTYAEILNSYDTQT